MIKLLFDKYVQYKNKSNKSYCHGPQECIICFENIYNEFVPTYVCNHMFHEKCINSWLIINNSCPICRTDLSIIHLSTIFNIATYSDVLKNTKMLTKIIKYIYNTSRKNYTYRSQVIFTNFHLIYFDISGYFTVWNETNPNDIVRMCIVLKNKIYSFQIPTIMCFQTIETLKNRNCCSLPSKKYRKIHIHLKFLENDLEISFLK